MENTSDLAAALLGLPEGLGDNHLGGKEHLGLANLEPFRSGGPSIHL